jgi:hypothetical protein
MPFFADAAKATSLEILVFGPNPAAAVASPAEKIGRLARKRIEIRDWLAAEGHNAQFPEDIYDRTSPGPFANVMYQEIVMMRRSDVIVVIVDSPGSNVELGAIAGRSDLASKTHAFIDEDFKGGLAYAACLLLSEMNGEHSCYKFPDDIDGCQLRARVLGLVTKIQLIKYLA